MRNEDIFQDTQASPRGPFKISDDNSWAEESKNKKKHKFVPDFVNRWQADPVYQKWPKFANPQEKGDEELHWM